MLLSIHGFLVLLVLSVAWFGRSLLATLWPYGRNAKTELLTSPQIRLIWWQKIAISWVLSNAEFGGINKADLHCNWPSYLLPPHSAFAVSIGFLLLLIVWSWISTIVNFLKSIGSPSRGTIFTLRAFFESDANELLVKASLKGCRLVDSIGYSNATI